MGRIRSFAGRHRIAVGAGSFLAVGLAVFVLVWFQPQKLFINKTVEESLPQAAPSTNAPVPTSEATTPAAATPTTATTPAGPTTLASGSFRSLEHETTGKARVVRLSDGALVLRLENLDTSNGPDLRVYLSEVPPDRGQNDYGDNYLDLGVLKGNRGNQNYTIPSGTDLSKYKSVVIWCRRFKVGFGVAPLD